MGFKVYKESCKNCLLSPDRIVSPRRAKEIIQDCAKKQVHFICHKASIAGEDVCCKTFYDKFGELSQLVRIAKRLNAVEEVDMPDGDRLQSYEEQKSKITPKRGVQQR